MNPVKGKVSIVTVAYNHEKFIKDSVTSALAQTYANSEIIVGDDGSSDGTKDVIADLALKNSTKIIPLFSSKNEGFAKNINRCFDRCSGEYIATLGGDDFMLPDKIAKQVEFLSKNEEYGLCTHDMEVFESKTGKVLYNTGERYLSPDGGIEEAFRTNWFFGPEPKTIPSSILARSAVFLTHRYRPDLQFWGDWLHMIDSLVTSSKKWGHLSEILGRYRVHDKQMHTSDEAAAVSFEQMLTVLAISSSRYPELTKLIKNKRDFILFQHLVFDWHPEEKREAFEKQFRIEAGLLKWMYMKLCRSYLHHRRLFEMTRPLRHFAKRVLADH